MFYPLNYLSVNNRTVKLKHQDLTLHSPNPFSFALCKHQLPNPADSTTKISLKLPHSQGTLPMHQAGIYFLLPEKFIIISDLTSFLQDLFILPYTLAPSIIYNAARLVFLNHTHITFHLYHHYTPSVISFTRKKPLLEFRTLLGATTGYNLN